MSKTTAWIFRGRTIHGSVIAEDAAEKQVVCEQNSMSSRASEQRERRPGAITTGRRLMELEPQRVATTWPCGCVPPFSGRTAELVFDNRVACQSSSRTTRTPEAR